MISYSQHLFMTKYLRSTILCLSTKISNPLRHSHIIWYGRCISKRGNSGEILLHWNMWSRLFKISLAFPEAMRNPLNENSSRLNLYPHLIFEILSDISIFSATSVRVWVTMLHFETLIFAGVYEHKQSSSYAVTIFFKTHAKNHR